MKAALQRMQRRKVPGLDSWRVGELRLLPDTLLEGLVQLFNRIEETGRLPQEMSEPEGLLLAKPGAPEGDPAMHRRPIWLLSVAYRVWAAGRARDLAGWICQWPGMKPFAAAESLVWELALELQEAHCTGTELGGIAADWSKAYDHIGLACGTWPLRRVCPSGSSARCWLHTPPRGGCVSRASWGSLGARAAEYCLDVPRLCL